MNCTCGSYSHDEKCDCKIETKLLNAQADLEKYKVLTSVLDGKLLNAQAELDKYEDAMDRVREIYENMDYVIRGKWCPKLELGDVLRRFWK